MAQSSSNDDRPHTPTYTVTAPLFRNQWFQLHFLDNIKVKTNLSYELSGAVGDLGTYISIVLALFLVSHLDLTTTLLFTALYNADTGLLFGVPMPVRPMKSIAAVANAESPTLTIPQIAAAGLSVAAVLLLLGSTGLMSFLYRYLPLPVVRGVQLSQGLSFAFSAIKYIRYNQHISTSKSGSPRSWVGLDGLIVALSAVLFLVLTTGAGVDCCENDEHDNNRPENSNGSRRQARRRLQLLSVILATLIVFLFGLLLCFLRDPSIIQDLRFGPSKISLISITWEDWKV